MKEIIKKRYIALIFVCYIVLIGVSFARPLVMKNIMDDGIIKKNFRVILSIEKAMRLQMLQKKGFCISGNREH